MDIEFELSFSEAIDRVVDAIWNEGAGRSALESALPRIQTLAEAHYLDVASNTRPLRSGDPGVGIESFAMFNDLTKPIIREDSIILETSLDYAMDQEERLRDAYGKSFLPDSEAIVNELKTALIDAFSK